MQPTFGPQIHQLGSEECDQSAPQAARGPRARDIPKVDPEVAVDDRRKVTERRVEDGHVLG